MSTIIVGVERSERSDDAIALARDLARATHARILLAAAVPCPGIALVVGAPVVTVAVDEAVRDLKELLADKASALRDDGITVSVGIEAYVSGAHLLQSLAESSPTDLIVVGSTRSGRMGRVVPGSTGERLLQGAPCPVAVAPAGYSAGRALRHVGIAFDGSEESRAALRGGMAVAARLGAALRVVTVLDVAGFASPALMSGPGYNRTRAEFEASARAHLDAVVAELPPEIRPEGRLLVGDPAEQLAEHSAELDLLVVGSRRYGPVRAVLLGGVSGKVIRHATCPVIVTPRGVDRPLEELFPATVTAAPAS